MDKRSSSLKHLLQRQNQGFERLIKWFQTHELVPTGPCPSPLPYPSKHHRRSALFLLTLLSGGLLLLGLGFYLYFWYQGYEGYLTSPWLQTDDARTFLFPFHQFHMNPAMGQDPIAKEMMDYVTPGVWLLYRITVPMMGVFWASKVVQIIALSIIFLAGVLLARAPKGGLAQGVLLVFLSLHTWFVMDRMAGGLPRGFAFPALALWIAGALAEDERIRWGSALVAALTYPTACLIILGAEGVLVLAAVLNGVDKAPSFQNHSGQKTPTSPPMERKHFGKKPWRGLVRYAILLMLTGAILSGFLAGRSKGGPLTTKKQAEKDPTFKRGGRIPVLPFRDPFIIFARTARLPFIQKGDTPIDSVGESYKELKQAGPWLIFILLFGLVALGLAPRPFVALALMMGAATLYLAARIWAFRLYIPDRYLQYGVPMVTIAMTTQVFGRLRFENLELGSLVLGLSKRRGERSDKRTGQKLPIMSSKKPPETSSNLRIQHNLGALVFMGIFLALTGTGVKKDTGMAINGKKHQKLHRLLQRLPLDARIAAHPKDADDIPFWAARASTGGTETAHPWYQHSWKKQKKRFKDIFRLLYATKTSTMFKIAQKYKITHILCNRSRYGGRFRKRALYYEPFGAFVKKLLKGVKRKELVLYKPPPESVVSRYGRFVIIDLNRLRKAFGT